MQAARTDGGDEVEFRLTVWPAGDLGWHARVVAPDATEHEFASPFELARYLAWPQAAPATGSSKGLR